MFLMTLDFVWQHVLRKTEQSNGGKFNPVTLLTNVGENRIHISFLLKVADLTWSWGLCWQSITALGTRNNTETLGLIMIKHFKKLNLKAQDKSPFLVNIKHKYFHCIFS